MIHQASFTFDTNGRGAFEITDKVRDAVSDARARIALCSVFIHHTSASLIVCENADAQVLADLDAFMSRLVPDGDPLFEHTAEGPDDMPSHVRSVLTQTSLALPVRDGELALGTWQGVFIYEHRHRAHARHVTVTIHGE